MAPKLNFGGGGEPCALCGKTVYAAERLKTTSEHIFHKQCFRCTKCSSLLQLATYAEDAVTGRVYCKPHYGQLAAAAGIHAAATGGVDAANSSVLVQKKQKKTLQEDVEHLIQFFKIRPDECSTAASPSWSLTVPLGGCLRILALGDHVTTYHTTPALYLGYLFAELSDPSLSAPMRSSLHQHCPTNAPARSPRAPSTLTDPVPLQKLIATLTHVPSSGSNR